MTGPVRFRVKGTTTYVDPVAVAMHRRTLMDGTAYQTVGTGQKSIRWRASSLGPNAALDGAAVTLRNQSRDMVRKNTWAFAGVERIVANTVGTGIKPKLTEEAQNELWLRWTDQADAAGVLDFYGLQAQAMAAVVVSGECFARMRVRKLSDGLVVPLQIELLEAEMVAQQKNETLVNGNTVRQGIEFDKNLKSKRVAYWIYPSHPDDATPNAGDNQPKRVAAEEVLHLFIPSRPGQIRGEPWMARALARLKDVEGYDNAELNRKKVAALFVGFIRRPSPEGLSLDDLEEMYGEESQINGGLGDVQMEPGAMNVLAPGEEIEFSAPADTGNNYEMFMRQQFRAISAALGVLYEQLTGDYGEVNDRTWRAAVHEFRRRCEMWQHNLIVFQFCAPIFRRWALLAGLSGADPAADPLALVQWTPPRWPYINPEQDITAIEKEIQAGLTSRARAVSERGEDAERIDAEQAEDNKRVDGLDVRYTSDGRNQVADVMAQEKLKAEAAKDIASMKPPPGAGDKPGAKAAPAKPAAQKPAPKK